MYSAFGDPVSTHTLATAALEVLRDLADHRGIKSPMPNPADAFPAHAAEIRKVFRAAQNFFKHADSDPTETLTFRHQATEFFLFEAVELYYLLAGDRPSVLRAFSAWFRLCWPKVFVFTEDEELRLNAVRELFRLGDRSQFFSLYCVAANKQRADSVEMQQGAT
jgi:hypothetical protein